MLEVISELQRKDTSLCVVVFSRSKMILQAINWVVSLLPVHPLYKLKAWSDSEADIFENQLTLHSQTYVMNQSQIQKKKNETFWQWVWHRLVNPDLYQFYTDMRVLIWYCPDATAVLIQFWKHARNRTFGNGLIGLYHQNIFCCVDRPSLMTRSFKISRGTCIPVLFMIV